MAHFHGQKQVLLTDLIQGLMTCQQRLMVPLCPLVLLLQLVKQLLNAGGAR